MNLNDIRKNAYLNQNKIDKSDFSDDEFFEEKKDNVIVAKNLQDNPTVKKFTFQSISKVVDEIPKNQKKSLKQSVIELYNQGYTIEQITMELSCSETEVQLIIDMI